MKSTGVVRRIDHLGRVVIPIELRRNMGVLVNDEVQFYVDGELIIIKKYEPSCMFCESISDLVTYKSKRICHDCLDIINNIKI